MDEFGFIILRHVNSEKTNIYWNHNVILLKQLYPGVKIVIIDDNSDQKLIKSFTQFDDIEVIQSEYPGRGELLPFIYYLRHNWFKTAIIIHDGLFIHKHISFKNINTNVLPLYHFNLDRENIENTIFIVNKLNNKYNLLTELQNSDIKVSINNKKNIGCFGCMCVIKNDFLKHLQNKYNIIKLTDYIKNRNDRCCLERIMGLIFSIENSYIRQENKHSLLGNISNIYPKMNYTFENYRYDVTHKNPIRTVTKVFTGR